MTIRFDCDQCGVSIKAPQQRAGAKLPCPKCGTQLTVPTSGADPDAKDEAAQFANLVTQLETDPKFPPSPAPGPAPGPALTTANTDAPQPSPPPTQDTDGTDEPIVSLTRKTTYETVGKGHVRIVDIKLPFASVLRLGLQIWVVSLLASFAFFIIFAMVALVLSALGVGFALQ